MNITLISVNIYILKDNGDWQEWDLYYLVSWAHGNMRLNDDYVSRSSEWSITRNV